MPDLSYIGQYAGIRSPLHGWDSRVKIVSITFMIYSIVSLNDLVPAFLGLVFSVSLILTSGISMKFIRGYMEWITLFIGFIFVLLSFTVPGDELFSLYSLSISYQGIWMGALIALRAFSAALLTAAMLGTTGFDETLGALGKLRIPNKLIQVLMFTYRYISVLSREMHRMIRSLNARGFRKRMDVRTMSIIGNFIGMLFVRSYERSERVYEAMVSRGYRGTVNSSVDFRIGYVDYVKGAVVMVLAVMLHII